MPAGFEDKNVVEHIFFFLITGKHLAPFWFVPTISIIYLFAPLLIRADRAMRPYYALPVLLGMSGALGRDGILNITHLGGYFSPVSKVIYLFPGYFFGMFCSRFREPVLQMVIVWGWPLILSAGAALIVGILAPNSIIQYIFLFQIITAIRMVYYLDIYTLLKSSIKYLMLELQASEYSFYMDIFYKLSKCSKTI